MLYALLYYAFHIPRVQGLLHDKRRQASRYARHLSFRISDGNLLHGALKDTVNQTAKSDEVQKRRALNLEYKMSKTEKEIVATIAKK